MERVAYQKWWRVNAMVEWIQANTIFDFENEIEIATIF